jgi:ATP-binding cassette subfamily C exporter for protease/lipase
MIRSQLLRDYRGAFWIAGLFTFCSAALVLALPFYIINLYQRILPNESYATLYFLTAGVLGAFLVMGALDSLRSTVFARIGERLDERLSRRVFAAMHRRGTGNREELNDVGKVRDFLTGQQIEAFFELPFVPIFLAVLFLMHPLLGMLGLTGALLLMGLGGLQHALSVRAHREGEWAARQDEAFAESSLRNLEVMEALGMRTAIRRRWQEIHDWASAARMRADDVIMGLSAWSMPIRFIFQIIVLGVGAYLVLQGDLQPGVMIAANILTMRAMMPAMKAMTSWRGFLDARDAYARLRAYESDDSPARCEAVEAQTARPAGPLEVTNLDVQVPETDRIVLRGIDIEVRAGELLGVTGPNGAGKSSFARAILGIWPAIRGQVKLGGIDIASFSDELRRLTIGYLPQDIALFAGTVAENIRRFGPRDDDGVVAAAKAAGVHGPILRLKKGYDTPIPEQGGALTGGQRQRLALARALYGDPNLLVLDEPNANLDTSGEDALLTAVQAAQARGAVVIMVTHKAQLLRRADRVLMLDRGELHALAVPSEVLGDLRDAKTEPANLSSKSAIEGAHG